MSDTVFHIGDLAVRLDGPDGPREVLTGISFDVGSGEIVGVVGRSGVGKTTLLRVLGGLVPPDGGVVTFRGAAVTGPPAGVAMVFQDYQNALLPWRTVARNVALGLEGKLSRRERIPRVQRALAMVGLGDRAGDYPWQLSGGMAQRVQIARALALESTALLMDEPFGALDAMTKASLQDVLLDVQRATGATLVFVTHDLDEAVYLSDRVIVLCGVPGRLAVIADAGLPRPRNQLETRQSSAFLQARHELGDKLRLWDG